MKRIIPDLTADQIKAARALLMAGISSERVCLELDIKMSLMKRYRGFGSNGLLPMLSGKEAARRRKAASRVE